MRRSLNKSDALETWERLAAAALNARDELRLLPAKIDGAMGDPAKAAALLESVRSIAIRHADSLRLALKFPK